MGLRRTRTAQDAIAMSYDPGLNRHEWESEFASIEEDLHTDPASALPGLDSLVARMLGEAGYDLDDPVAREGEEREVISDYLAAHEITRLSEAGSTEISSGDVAAAINGLRELYDYVVENYATADADL
jgi:hypothetical protein